LVDDGNDLGGFGGVLGFGFRHSGEIQRSRIGGKLFHVEQFVGVMGIVPLGTIGGKVCKRLVLSCLLVS
jgi:hypothetical protein